MMSVPKRAKMPSLFGSIKSMLGLGSRGSMRISDPDHAALTKAAFESDRVFRGLQELCLRIGARPNGSKAYADALAWAQKRMLEEGLQAVKEEQVLVPNWRRGEEWAEILALVPRPLPILGLGMSVPTPEEGLTGEILSVGSFEELEGLPEERVAGRIVLMDIPTGDWEDWVRVRVMGASAAARRGASAVLVRSFATERAQPVRTGRVVYEFGVPEIPAAAISTEDAQWLHQAGQGVQVHLRMRCQLLPEALSQNLIGEIPGRERPEEIVLLNAHLDSWDLGQGAQDNGAGCLLAMECARLIGQLNPRPRRTVRVLLAAGGVTGGHGMMAYLESHQTELSRHLAVIEVDGGSGPGRGFFWAPFRSEGTGRFRSLDLEGLRASLAPLRASRITESLWGWDIDSITRTGVPLLSLEQEMPQYLDVLHSSKDSIDSVRDEDLRRNAAILALAVHFLADQRDPESAG